MLVSEYRRDTVTAHIPSATHDTCAGISSALLPVVSGAFPHRAYETADAYTPHTRHTPCHMGLLFLPAYINQKLMKHPQFHKPHPAYALLYSSPWFN